MSVERVERLLLEMTEEERIELWARMKRRGVDVTREGGIPTLELHEVIGYARKHGGSDALRRMACEKSNIALDYARFVDKGPHGHTRAAACTEPSCALAYARDVDKGPCDMTRRAACKSPSTAEYYAFQVDKCPRDDTRNAACRNHEHALFYALDVDSRPRDDTRTAATRDPHSALFYALYVDEGYHPVTWKGVKGTESEAEYRGNIGVPEGVE